MKKLIFILLCMGLVGCEKKEFPPKSKTKKEIHDSHKEKLKMQAS